jgi:very-short-patch-repair endonuclease
MAASIPKVKDVRDSALAPDAYRVLRFWNSDVLKNRDGVLSAGIAELENISD